MRTLSAAFIVPTLESIVSAVLNTVSAYDAADAGDSNVFGLHIGYAVQQGQDKEQLELYFRKFEGLYKGETGVKSMPNPYRSAKSVISNAVELGIDLLNEDNLPRGKSELQKLIKESKSVKSADSKFADGCAMLCKYLEGGEMTISQADAAALLSVVVTTMQANLK